MTKTPQPRSTSGRWIRIGITLVGILLIAAGLLVDVVMSNLNSGIGPMQMAVIAFGVTLIILAWIRLSAMGRGLVSVITIVVMLIVMEVLLAVAGFKPDYNVPSGFDINDPVELEIHPSRVCDDERGCHWNVEYARENCPEDTRRRDCHPNDYGMTSEVEFTEASLDDNQYRILVLGDSFTWGAAADYGQGWVDVMRDNLNQNQEVLIWNAAMPGTGTSQAIITAHNLIPIMQPDLVILGFHTGNDFADNLYPYDRFITVVDDEGTPTAVQQYSFDADGNPFRETDAVIYYRARGYNVSSSTTRRMSLINLMQRTRLGTLLVGTYRVVNWTNNNLPPSETLVSELDTFVSESGSELLIVLIPEQNDARQNPTQKYKAGLALVNNTGIPYVDTLPLLSHDDFENRNKTDKHLNNNGHRIVGELVTTCVSQIIETDTIGCE